MRRTVLAIPILLLWTSATLASPGVERVVRRGATSLVTALEDGRYEVLITSQPIHYRAEDGSWQPVDDTLVAVEGGFENRTNHLRTRLPALATGPVQLAAESGERISFVPSALSVSRGRGAYLEIGPPAMRAGLPDPGVTGRLVYPQVWPGVDEEYRVSAIGLKHDIVLDSPPRITGPAGSSLVFAWEMRTSGGLEPCIGGTPVRGRSRTRGAIELRGAGGAHMGILPPRIHATPPPGTHFGEETTGTWVLEPRKAGGFRLELHVPLGWLLDPARVYPVRIDPTVLLYPLSDVQTGMVAWDLGTRYDRRTGPIVSGTLNLVNQYWIDVEGFARFFTGPIPAGVRSIDDVDLLVWIANHDNPNLMPPELAAPLPMQIRECAVDPLGSPNQQVFDAIRTGTVWVSALQLRTGPPFPDSDFCVNSFEYYEFDLGPQADAALRALLPQQRFTVGFTSQIVDDPYFDHIDYIGYPEQVDGSCNPSPFTPESFPGSRIALRVTYTPNTPPVCDAGDPRLAECAGPATTVLLEGTRSYDPDGDPITFAWTSDCPGGAFDDPALPAPSLTLATGGSCRTDCRALLTVSDPWASTSCWTSVAVVDTTPPEIHPGPDEGACLWPPNHRYLCFEGLSGLATASDACQPDVTLALRGCASDQPEDAPDDAYPGQNGDGSTLADCVVSPYGNAFCVRSERLGTEPGGRHYGFALEAADSCGNAVTAGGTLYVPHDQSPRESCLPADPHAFLLPHEPLPWE